MLFVSDTFGGNVGLAISQSLILNGMLQHGMRLTAEVVNQMTSVERVLEYTKVEKETDLETHPGKLVNSLSSTLGHTLSLIYDVLQIVLPFLSYKYSSRARYIGI
jgi:hypothetical protein